MRYRLRARAVRDEITLTYTLLIAIDTVDAAVNAGGQRTCSSHGASACVRQLHLVRPARTSAKLSSSSARSSVLLPPVLVVGRDRDGAVLVDVAAVAGRE